MVGRGEEGTRTSGADVVAAENAKVSAPRFAINFPFVRSLSGHQGWGRSGWTSPSLPRSPLFVVFPLLTLSNESFRKRASRAAFLPFVSGARFVTLYTLFSVSTLYTRQLGLATAAVEKFDAYIGIVLLRHSGNQGVLCILCETPGHCYKGPFTRSGFTSTY